MTPTFHSFSAIAPADVYFKRPWTNEALCSPATREHILATTGTTLCLMQADGDALLRSEATSTFSSGSAAGPSFHDASRGTPSLRAYPHQDFIAEPQSRDCVALHAKALRKTQDLTSLCAYVESHAKDFAEVMAAIATTRANALTGRDLDLWFVSFYSRLAESTVLPASVTGFWSWQLRQFDVLFARLARPGVNSQPFYDWLAHIGSHDAFEIGRVFEDIVSRLWKTTDRIATDEAEELFRDTYNAVLRSKNVEV